MLIYIPVCQFSMAIMKFLLGYRDCSTSSGPWNQGGLETFIFIQWWVYASYVRGIVLYYLLTHILSPLWVF